MTAPATFAGPAIPRNFRPEIYRSTMGVSLGLRGLLTSAVVVLSVRRDDPTRTHYVAFEWEEQGAHFDNIAAALAHGRKTFRTRYTFGHSGVREEEKTIKVLSVRLGHWIEPAPVDATAPTTTLIDDFRAGRIRARADSLVARDVQAAMWRDGLPDQTGIIVALRCASWAAQMYRARKVVTREEKEKAAEVERRRRLERPY